MFYKSNSREIRRRGRRTEFCSDPRSGPTLARLCSEEARDSRPWYSERGNTQGGEGSEYVPDSEHATRAETAALFEVSALSEGLRDRGALRLAPLKSPLTPARALCSPPPFLLCSPSPRPCVCALPICLLFVVFPSPPLEAFEEHCTSRLGWHARVRALSPTHTQTPLPLEYFPPPCTSAQSTPVLS